jgi:hypothetical protein
MPRIGWRPQAGPQHALVECPVFEIFYGGARGGGKTDGMLGKWAIKADRYGEDAVGVFFRKTREDLKEAIERSKQIYTPIGAKFAGKQWLFPSGARLKFEYLERDQDAENYQGHNYTDLFFEELTHWADPGPVNKLKATLRSAKGVPCQFHATGNPGGPGHNWVKARYIDPAPLGGQVITEDFVNPFNGEVQTLDRVFIPSKLTDNPLLIEADPLYIAKLQQSGSAQLVKAWLKGDWNVVEGAYFDCWSDLMVIDPFTIPGDSTRFMSFDWGSAAPFSNGWWAIMSEPVPHNGIIIPRGAMIRYREWYGAKAPNKGLKLTAEKVAEGIQKRTTEELNYAVADPSIFSEDGGPSIAERMLPIPFHRADNKRVGRLGQIGGWDQMRSRMIGTRTINDDGTINEDGVPMIYCFKTCTDSIRTIPGLQHDPNKAEDLDTNAEDHAADDWRYGCMSRPWTGDHVEPEPEIDRWDRAFGDNDDSYTTGQLDD